MSDEMDYRVTNTIGAISIMIYLDKYSDERIKLPVIPDQLEIRTGLSNNTVDVVSLGEVGIIGNSKLRAITISSFFPAGYSSYCQVAANELVMPYTAVEMIQSWMKGKKPIGLNISGMGINDMLCMIDEFSYREKGGQPGTVYYDLVLKEFKVMKPRIIDIQSITGGKPEVKAKNRRPDERNIPSKYIVKSGDCLYTIAKRFYKDGSKWKLLYEKNKAKIGKDPNLIRPGQELIL